MFLFFHRGVQLKSSTHFTQTTLPLNITSHHTISKVEELEAYYCSTLLTISPNYLMTPRLLTLLPTRYDQPVDFLNLINPIKKGFISLWPGIMFIVKKTKTLSIFLAGFELWVKVWGSENVLGGWTVDKCLRWLLTMVLSIFLSVSVSHSRRKCFQILWKK